MTAPALWRRPGFGRFWAASTVSEFGTPITTLAVQVLADQFGAQPALVIGMVGVAVASAGLMLSPFRRATA